LFLHRQQTILGKFDQTEKIILKFEKMSKFDLVSRGIKRNADLVDSLYEFIT
jgi:hypothetical protein